MSAYSVTRKTDGVEVYKYSAESPIEWSGFEFSTHNHTKVPEPVVDTPIQNDLPQSWYINIGPFYDRFGIYKMPILASSDLLVQAVIKDTVVRKYIDLKGRRAELQQSLALIQSKGFAVDVAAILDVKPTPEEVWNGY